MNKPINLNKLTDECSFIKSCAITTERVGAFGRTLDLYKSDIDRIDKDKEMQTTLKIHRMIEAFDTKNGAATYEHIRVALTKMGLNKDAGNRMFFSYKLKSTIFIFALQENWKLSSTKMKINEIISKQYD